MTVLDFFHMMEIGFLIVLAMYGIDQVVDALCPRRPDKWRG